MKSGARRSWRTFSIKFPCLEGVWAVRKFLVEMNGACGGLNAKRQTPNAKLQTASDLDGVLAAKTFEVWRLAFGVWRLAARSAFPNFLQ